MPKPVAKSRSILNRLRESLFKRLFRARFRYDVFISYNHAAKEYAANLKRQLTELDFTCFFDYEESPAGLSLDPTLAKALRKSAVLVLLATERALTRPYVALEFEKFAATGRRIIPINIADALTTDHRAALAVAPWDIIKSRNLIWIDEPREAFEKRIPSPAIADGIDKLFKYTRRNVRVRTEIIGTAAVVLIATLGAALIIKGKNVELSSTKADLSNQIKLLDVAKIETAKQQVVAATARAESLVQLAFARQAKSDADQARAEASHQQEMARAATAEAENQQRIARDATSAAEKQKTIAAARRLANEAELVRGGTSDEIFRSASTAIRSLTMYPTLEGDLALRRNLKLLSSPPKEETYGGRLGSVAISPDAKAVAFLTPDSEMEIRRSGSVEIKRKRPVSHSLIALSNDGQNVATAGGNSVRVEHVDSHQVREWSIFEEANIKAIALSSGGKYLALIARAEEGVWVEVYDCETQKPVGKPIHGSIDFSNFESVAFSSDKEAVLAVGGQEKSGGLRRIILMRCGPGSSDRRI